MYLIPGAIWIGENQGIIREDHKNCLFDKREISSDKPSPCREEIGNVFVKRVVMVKAGTPPSISEETICKVVQKTDLKWTHFQRNRILIKSELKLRLKFEFAGKVCNKRGMCKYEISNDQKDFGACREGMGNVSVKTGVMVKAGFPPSIREETVCKVVQKTDLKWTHFQRNRILIKSELK